MDSRGHGRNTHDSRPFGYSIIGVTSMGSSTARNQGTCWNLPTIRRDMLEASVLDGLHRHLMEPALVKDFCEALIHPPRE